MSAIDSPNFISAQAMLEDIQSWAKANPELDELAYEASRLNRNIDSLVKSLERLEEQEIALVNDTGSQLELRPVRDQIEQTKQDLGDAIAELNAKYQQAMLHAPEGAYARPVEEEREYDGLAHDLELA
jgi:predicted  nucleic acid-binding Zn-ribbon protein